MLAAAAGTAAAVAAAQRRRHKTILMGSQCGSNRSTRRRSRSIASENAPRCLICSAPRRCFETRHVMWQQPSKRPRSSPCAPLVAAQLVLSNLSCTRLSAPSPCCVFVALIRLILLDTLPLPGFVPVCTTFGPVMPVLKALTNPHLKSYTGETRTFTDYSIFRTPAWITLVPLSFPVVYSCGSLIFTMRLAALV